jgi:NAD(P)-dependent dehydrogenase (short-subunit alcohol dehydrogenase family)
MGKLDGKVAIVTGSGRGIGAEIAVKLASDGAAVVVNDLDEEPAKETVAAVEAAGGRAVAVTGDVTATGFAERFTQAALDSFGGLDIIVNNAGYTWDSVIQKMTDEQWDAILDVHLKAPFRGPARRPADHLRVRQAGPGQRRARALPQGRQHLLDRRARRQRRAGQLRGGQGRRHRPDQGAGQGVGTLQRHR